MVNAITNIGQGTLAHDVYHGSTEDIIKELEVFFGNRVVKDEDITKFMQDQNNKEVIGSNKDIANREVNAVAEEATSQNSYSSDDELNRQQAESLYYSSILPEVEKTFIYRGNANHPEVPIIGIIDVLEAKVSIDKILNFLCNDPDFIPQIIEKGNALEFTKVIDLLLKTIKNTGISEVESQQAFLVLDRLYKKLPEVAHIKPSLYGKMHALFGLVLNYNRQGVIHTLIEAMTSDYNKKYFDLYINNNAAIENNYLSLITEIYASPEDNQESDYILFEKLLAFLGANDLVEKDINSAKALHLAISISDIVYMLDEDDQDRFIEYFLGRKVKGNKFDDLLVAALEKDRLLEDYNIIIKNKKDISKIPQYNVIDYLADQDQEICTSNKIDNKWLLETTTGNRKQQILSMIDKLDVYSCHGLADYLLSTDDIVFKEVIASKSTKVYEHMIDFLITKLQNETTISEEDSYKIAKLVSQLYIMLPSIGTQARPLCSKIYKAFNLLLPNNINLILDTLHQATNSNCDFYFPLSLSQNKKVVSDFLDLITKIYETPTDDYKLFYEVLDHIKINISDDVSNSKILFFSEKLYKIIIDLQGERQSMAIKSLLDSLKLSVDMKYYLYCLFYDANVNIPECNFKPLDQLAMEHTKQRMKLIKIRDPDFFQQ
jgi:hypothetical protein